MDNIYIIGMGYIGFPLACLLAKKKKINCIDIDKEKIEKFKNKILPFKEKNLKNLFIKYYSKFKFDTKILNVKKHNTYIICVPTPLIRHKADLKFLYNVFDSLNNLLKKNDLIIIESTIPPKTTEKIYKKYKLYNKNVYLAYCPERAIPGNTLKEMKNNHRIIGGINTISSLKAKKIYSLVSKNIILTNSIEAEISKLAENTYRLVNISLANEINSLCKNFNLKSKDLFKITNLHPRVNFLKPGIGIGGHCIPIDPLFLNERNNIKLINSSIKTDKKITNSIIKEILSNINNKNKDKILCLGITYKENVDDLRESPAIKIINSLRKKVKNMSIYDPLNKSFNNIDKKNLKNFKFDLVIFLVRHDSFIKLKIKSKKILDYRH